MSEVHRYQINGTFEVPEIGQTWVNPKMVLESDFDRVTAERDAYKAREAESRNDLAKSLADHFRKNAEISELQQRLTAADERADVLEGLLREVEAACDLAMSAIDDDGRGANFVQIIAAIKAKAVPKRSDELVAQHAAIDFFDAALKPAEVKCGVCGQGAWVCSEGGCHYLEDGNGEPVERGADDKCKADFIRLNSAPHCPECGHPDCNGQCFGDDMMGD